MDCDAAQWAAVEEATELLHEERFHEALECFGHREADPTNPYAFFFLGQALYEVGELEPARDAYRARSPCAAASRRAGRDHHVLRKLGATRDASPKA